MNSMRTDSWKRPLLVLLALLAIAVILFDRGWITRLFYGLDTESFPASDYDPTRFPPSGRPLVGTNYTHFSFSDCDGDFKSILGNYHRNGVARTVHSQLIAMRKSGISSLRILIWHMTDTPGQRWGPVPSRGGRLPEPYRSNFTNFLTEVRRFGFARLTVAFGPMWSNNPLRQNFDPDKIDENWRFIQDVRQLARRHGPPDTRFDLLNEGAPSDYRPSGVRAQAALYLTDLYARYARTFGSADVTVSTIAPRTSRDRGNRLQNLIDIFAASGHGQPGWYELHLNFAPGQVLHGLLRSDAVLAQNGLPQPVVIGETSYNDLGAALAISVFLAYRDRPIDEITQWVNRPSHHCNFSPPYSASAYLELADDSVMPEIDAVDEPSFESM